MGLNEPSGWLSAIIMETEPAPMWRAVRSSAGWSRGLEFGFRASAMAEKKRSRHLFQ